MSSVRRVWSVAVLLALATFPAAFGQSLEDAQKLYDEQQYLAAQEMLLKLDRAALNDEQRARVDALLVELPELVKAAERAAQDLAAADKAYDEGDWDAADELYANVEGSRAAPAAARERAMEQRDRIVEKKKLADAAKPQGVVEQKEHRYDEPADQPVVERKTAERIETPAGVEERRVTERVDEGPVREAGAPAEEREIMSYRAGETGPARRTLEEAPAAFPAEDVGPRRLTPTEQLRIADELRWQRAVAQAQAAANRAREAVTVNDFTAARQEAANALQSIEAAARYAEPVSKYEAARDEMVALRDEVAAAEEDFQRAAAVREREEIADRIAKRRALLEQQRQEQVDQLFISADQLRKERRYSESAEVLRQILRIDPANVRARYQLDVMEDYEAFGRQGDTDRIRGAEQRRALLLADESLIPWDYDVLYPRNWLELTARRSSEGSQTGVKFEDVELNRRLEEVMPEVRFEEANFDQVIDFIGDYTKLNLSVDWTDLDDKLLVPAREKQVTVRLQNLSVRTVLREVLAQVGGETELSFSVGDGLVRIASKEKLNRDKFILIYDVRDLLVTVPQADRPDFTQNNQGLQVGTGGGGGGQSVFGTTNQQTQQQQDPGQDVEITKLKEIIRQTVEPDSWVEAGAGPGGASIQDLNGQLLIYNTSDAHRQVVDLLRQLRETQALQVSVEARFLDVTSNFLEQFGVDLDFVFNAGTAGYDRAPDLSDPFTGAPVLIPRQYSRIGSIPATPGLGLPMAQGVPLQPYGAAGLIPQPGGILPTSNEMTPIGAQQGSLALVDPTAINTGVPGSWSQRSGLQPALSIAGSFLDNLQVDFLIRATQANSRSSIVQAPRAVMLNGQAVEIRIEAVRSYVSSLDPVVGEQVALARPIVDQANSGISMWVQSVISADRKYTKLSIALLQQSEPQFERFELLRASGNSPGAFILLPRFNRITYTTTVSVPDGGTVLLGGFKQVGEVEVDAGVPILNKIPVLKRAFSNETTVKDTRTLLILVKSKILIQREAEEEAFPTFTRSAGV